MGETGQKPIPFVNDQRSGWEELAGASPLAVNVIIDGQGGVFRRPGIAGYANEDDGTFVAIDDSLRSVSTGVGGVWVTLGGTLYAVDQGAPQRGIYRVPYSSQAALTDLLSIDPGDLAGGLRYDLSLIGSGRPVFAETEAMLVIAGGLAPQKVLFAPAPASSRLAGSPPDSTHMVAMYSRLVSNNVSTGKTQFHYSKVGLGATGYTEHEVWSGVGAGIVTAIARPDPIAALGETTNELYVFGDTTTEIYSSDTKTVFNRVQAREVGCGAPYSVVKVDQTMFWVDQQRRIVSSDGRSLDVLSDPLQATFDAMATVSDAFGYRVRLGPMDAVVWTFPTDKRTFCYQLGGGWSQWMGWDDARDEYKRFAVNCHTHRVRTGDNVVGLLSGQIGVLRLSAQTDMGERIVAEVVSGYLNHGTDRLKRCVSVRLAFRRGTVTGSTSPLGWLYFRDEPGDWGQPLRVEMGRSADTEPVVELRGLGVYRRRQWRFVFSDTERLVLAGVSEEFEVLDN